MSKFLASKSLLSHLPLLLLCCLIASFLPAQNALHTKMQLLPDGETWGVYVKPDSSITPTTVTITGSAQVTVVMPLNYQWSGLTNYAGSWIADAHVHGPADNPGRTYVSFGLVTDSPQILYKPGQETLLFTFKRMASCPDSLCLIDCNSSNVTNPYCPEFPDLTPNMNCFDSNPGNEFSVIDFGDGGSIYGYAGNYAPSAWSCHDYDNDGIPNAIEDSNGDGVWTPGIDASDLGVPSAPACSADFLLNIHPADQIVCPDTATSFFVEAHAAYLSSMQYRWQRSINGGQNWVTLSESSQFSGINNPILHISSPSGMHTHRFRCQVKTGACDWVTSTEARLKLAGPISLLTQPADALACAGETAFFFFKFYNAGAVPLHYQWQKSCDGGSTWVNLNEAFPHINTSGLLTRNFVSDTLEVTSPEDLAGCLYRVKLKAGNCPPIFSEPAALMMLGEFSCFSSSDTESRRENGDEGMTEGVLSPQLFPNPVGETLTLLWGEGLGESPVFLEIARMDGNLLASQTFHAGGALQVDVRDLAAGLYLLRLRREGEALVVHRFVKAP